MTYGLRIVNNSGGLVISDERIVPRFVGKATYSSSTASDGGTVLTYTLSGMVPGDLYVSAFTLPDNGPFVWYGQFGNQAVTANGSGVVTVSIRAQSFSGGTFPEVYVFTLSRPGSDAAGSYGLALRDSTGQLTYTTAQNPLMVAQMPNLPLGSSVMPEGMPAKPAFFPSAYIRIVMSNTSSGGGMGPGSYNISGWFGGYRFSEGRLYTSEVQYVNQGGPGNLTPATFQYGSNATQPIPTINAASYD